MPTVQQLMEAAAAGPNVELFDLSISPPEKKRRGRSESSQRIPDVTALATVRSGSRPRAGTPQPWPAPGRRRPRPSQSVDWSQVARVDAHPSSDFELQVKSALNEILGVLGQHADDIKGFWDSYGRYVVGIGAVVAGAYVWRSIK